NCRRNEARPMRQHQAESLRHERGVLCDDEPVGAVREIAYEYSVEAGVFVGLRETSHIVDVDRRSARRVNLRRRLRADHADELNAHGRAPTLSAEAGAQPAASASAGQGSRRIGSYGNSSSAT